MARVVLVEDEVAIALLVATKFRNAGHEVHIAADGEEGLALVLERRPDVVLLDIMLPRADGYSVCESIRDQMGQDTRPVVVLLSARSQQADRQRGIEAGCDDYITKPFSPASLLERVTALVERKNRRELSHE